MLTAVALFTIGYLAMQLHDHRPSTQINLHIGNSHHNHIHGAELADDRPLLSIDVHISHRAPKPLPGGMPRLIHQTWKDEHVPKKFGHWPWRSAASRCFLMTNTAPQLAAAQP